MASGNHCNKVPWAPGLAPKDRHKSLKVTEDLRACASAIGWGNARRDESLAWERLSYSGCARMGDHCARAQFPVSTSVYRISRWGQQVLRASLVKA